LLVVVQRGSSEAAFRGCRRHKYTPTPPSLLYPSRQLEPHVDETFHAQNHLLNRLDLGWSTPRARHPRFLCQPNRQCYLQGFDGVDEDIEISPDRHLVSIRRDLQ